MQIPSPHDARCGCKDCRTANKEGITISKCEFYNTLYLFHYTFTHLLVCLKQTVCSFLFGRLSPALEITNQCIQGTIITMFDCGKLTGN